MPMVNDETSRILAERGTPEACFGYAMLEARRVFTETREAAKAAFRLAVPEAAGHDLVSAFVVPGTAASDALIAAVRDAAEEYNRTLDEVKAAYPLAFAEVTA